jgi:DNA polymerase-3 subunit epsilon
MLIDEATFVVTDTETTGLRPGPNRVIEIGAVKVKGGEIVDRFDQLVNPGTSVPRQITRLTGITTPMVFAAPPSEQVLRAYTAFLQDGVFVGHNAAFDKKFLQFELRQAGLEFRIGSALCTRRLARRLLHALPSKSLSSLMRHYRITSARRHRAYDDALATAKILTRLLTALRNETGLESLDELLRLQHTRHERHRTVPPHIRRIREEHLKILPEVPGVYLFKDGADALLYVGKARNLKSRVRSYFVGIDTHPMRIRHLVRAVRDIDFVPTPSELSALILESRLLKAYHPRYNRAEVRYRNLPFIRVTPGEPDRSISWSYEINPDGASYFGPLKGRHEAETFVNIGRRYPSLFTGGIEGVQERLADEMTGAAARLDFESARVIRDELEFLRGLAARPIGAGFSVLDHNAVWVQRSEKRQRATVICIRHGRLEADFTVTWPPKADEWPRALSTIASAYSRDETDLSTYRKREIDEVRVIANWIYRMRDKLQVVPVTVDSSPDEVAERVAILLEPS